MIELPIRTDCVIKNATIVSMDPVIGDLEIGSIRIRAGAIIEVATDITPTSDEEVIDAAGMIALPGFVDTHWHLWNVPLRRYMSADDPNSGYFPISFALGPSYLPEDTYAATRLGLAEAIFSGITTVHDWSHNVRGPEWADASLSAFVDTGLRGRFSYGWAQQGSSDEPMDIAGLNEIYQRWFADDKYAGSLQLGIASRNLVAGQSIRRAISLDTAREDWNAARTLGIPITLHANPPGLVTMLDEAGLMGSDLVLVHPMVLTERECHISAEYNAVWSMSSIGESGWSLGWQPDQGIRFQELDQLGVRMGLSIDASCIDGSNFFAVMRTLYRNVVNRLGPGCGITWRRMLELATIDGARALNLDQMIGSLTPGKRADVILLNPNTPNMALATDHIMAITALAEPENVDTVIADGRILMRGRNFESMDVGHVIAEADASAQRIYDRSKRN